jgi:hypothetical protein
LPVLEALIGLSLGLLGSGGASITLSPFGGFRFCPFWLVIFGRLAAL